MTFTYIIELPKDIKVKEAYLTMLDEYKLPIAQIKIKDPVIGKETKVEWDGRMNKGPNAGDFIPPGHFSVKFTVVPFYSIEKKTDSNEIDSDILDIFEE